MAHLISTVSGKAEASFAGQPAWHGLGKVTKGLQTALEMIENASLNYPTFKEPAYVCVNGQYHQIEGKHSTYRIAPDGTIVPLGVVGEKYTILQNAEAFNWFDEIVGQGKARYESAGAIMNGRRVWILVRLEQDLVVRAPGGEDRSATFVLLFNSHDGTSAVEILPTNVRVVCNNTLELARWSGFDKSKDDANKNRAYRIHHTQNIRQGIREAGELMGTVQKNLESTAELFSKLASIRFTSDDVVTAVNGVFPLVIDAGQVAQRNHATLTDCVVENFKRGRGAELAGETGWGCLNALTEFVDHTRYSARIGRAGSNESAESRFRTCVLGDGAAKKNRAVEVVTEMALAKVN